MQHTHTHWHNIHIHIYTPVLCFEIVEAKQRKENHLTRRKMQKQNYLKTKCIIIMFIIITLTYKCHLRDVSKQATNQPTNKQTKCNKK